jgi:hypothetical protein
MLSATLTVVPQTSDCSMTGASVDDFNCCRRWSSSLVVAAVAGVSERPCRCCRSPRRRGVLLGELRPRRDDGVFGTCDVTEFAFE